MTDQGHPSSLDYIAEHVSAVMIAGAWYDVEPGTFQSIPAWKGERSYRFENTGEGHMYVSADAIEALRWSVPTDE